MNSYLLVSFLPLVSSLVDQSAGVRGVLLCGDKPLANTKIKLYDDDSGKFIGNIVSYLEVLPIVF